MPKHVFPDNPDEAPSEWEVLGITQERHEYIYNKIFRSSIGSNELLADSMKELAAEDLTDEEWGACWYFAGFVLGRHETLVEISARAEEVTKLMNRATVPGIAKSGIILPH